MGTNAACFQRVGKIYCDKLGLNIHLRTGIRIYELPFIMKAGLPSNPKNFDGRRRRILLRTPESEIDNMYRESDDINSVETSFMQLLLKTPLKHAAKASVASRCWVRQFPSI